jgi:acetyltransferase-like isoleucine patch superfamily enzyme/acyl carrier protein
MKGVEAPKNCWILNKPHIRKTKGSRIIIGERVTLNSSSRLNPLTEHPLTLRTLSPTATIELKDNSGISGATIICANRITVGEYSIIGANTLIYDSDGHSYDSEKGWNTPRLLSGRPISIGKKCFIGTRCIILGGVTIGDSCLISAGTVLTQDVPSGHKAYGNPAIIEPLPQVLGGISPTSKVSSDREGCITPTSLILTPEEEEFLKLILSSLELSEPLNYDDDFRNHEEWDSIAFLTLASLLQEKYDFSLTSENYNKYTTLRSLYEQIKS